VIALRALLLPLVPIPKPAVHDEFSYLLGADTFASGRLSNPTHPMWVHFETFHVNHTPAYAAKYPPAQSLFLGFGQAVFGHPWYGVLISMGLLFGALCWMLQGWVSTSPLLVTLGILAAEWALSGHWINSYWGGAVPALGGALVVGALVRLARRPGSACAAIAAAGFMILANTRPYEGALTAIGFVAALLFWRRRMERPLKELFTRGVLLSFLAVIIPGIAAMAYYNVRTTGSATVMPYMVNQAQYAASPHIYVLPAGPMPVYRHEVIQKLWAEWDRDIYLKVRSQPWLAAEQLVSVLYKYVIPEGFALAAAGGIVLAWGVETAALLTVAGLPVAALLLAKSIMPHYFAPIFGALVVLIATGIERFGRIRIRLAGYPAGALLVVLVMGLSFRHAGLKFVTELLGPAAEHGAIVLRDSVIAKLKREGGHHLIMVRYGPDHDIHREWVYNSADIDGSDVVWARDMTPGENQELFDYYKDRKIWLLQPDSSPRRPVPYPR
jgi:hypothetical protein